MIVARSLEGRAAASVKPDTSPVTVADLAIQALIARRLGEDFPTSALAAISFAAEDWSSVHPRGGRLEHFVTPDWLATATD